MSASRSTSTGVRYAQTAVQRTSLVVGIVFLVVGLAGFAGLLFARAPRASRNYLMWGGVIYLVLWLYGLVFSGPSDANLVPLNNADNWLHLFLGVGVLLLGLLVGRRVARSSASSSATRS